MKGWRPSASSKDSKPVRAFCGRILAGHRIDRPVFFPRPRFPPAHDPGIMARDPWTGVPFSRSSAPRPPSRTNTPERRRSKKAPALRLLRETEGTRKQRQEGMIRNPVFLAILSFPADRRSDRESRVLQVKRMRLMDSRSSALRPSGMTRDRPRPPLRREVAQKRKKARGVGVSRKGCAFGEGNEGFNLDFVPPDLEFVPPGLDFVPKNLDFRQQEPSPGFSDAPTSRACLAITSPKTFP